jgi:uncharacterized protein (TIGR03437 family)
MKKLTIVALFLVSIGTLPAQDLRVVNAASLSSVSVSPGSIITIFGSQLTVGTASTTNPQTPPTALGGATVTVGGTPAALLYTSPTQINAVLNTATPTGVQTVTVSSSAAGTHSGSVTIDTNAAPGLFSFSGSGTRDGAILNAITFLLGDFSTQTAGSPTFLALFATGLNTSAAPTVTVGGVSVQVVFSGAAPCCAGLEQINVVLPSSLAGAGRVPVTLTSNGQTSNTVQIVLLPPSSAREFPDDEDNRTRSRELASLAYVPGTSLALSTDENDDVVRVIDLSARKVSSVITLPDAAAPDGIAVNDAGTLAVVAESNRGKAAVINLTNSTVVTEIATAAGPAGVAIAGSQAVVVNQDAGSVSIIDLGTNTVQKTLATGHGPKNVAVNSTAHLAYLTNEDDGTISVIDLTGLAVTKTISLGASVRPEAIALIPGTNVAFVALPAASPNGQVLLVDLNAGTVSQTIQANPDRSGGTSDVAFFNSNVYFANQAGRSVSVLPVTASGAAAGSITTIPVDLGPRALAIDTKDKLLVVSNEGTGTLVLIDLTSNAVVARIKAVATDGDDDHDDHSDRGSSANAPSIKTLSPASSKAGVTITLTITGANLTGATGIEFIDPASLPVNATGKGIQDKNADSAFAVSNIQVANGSTQLTATVMIAASAKVGPRLVKIVTPNGESSGALAVASTFTVLP